MHAFGRRARCSRKNIQASGKPCQCKWRAILLGAGSASDPGLPYREARGDPGCIRLPYPARVSSHKGLERGRYSWVAGDKTARTYAFSFFKLLILNVK